MRLVDEGQTESEVKRVPVMSCKVGRRNDNGNEAVRTDRCIDDGRHLPIRTPTIINMLSACRYFGAVPAEFN